MQTMEAAADAHTSAEWRERLRHGGEALRRLKPHERRALRLQAAGYSYREIAELSGWTYTKVNRCISEGRRAFRKALEDIESGRECARLAPVLAELGVRRTTAAELADLRAHLATCLACRATLRARRASATAAHVSSPHAHHPRPAPVDRPDRRS